MNPQGSSAPPAASGQGSSAQPAASGQGSSAQPAASGQGSSAQPAASGQRRSSQSMESSSVPSLSLSGHREQSLPGQNQSDSGAKNTSGLTSGSKQKDQNVPCQNQREKSAQSKQNNSGKSHSGEKAGVSVGQDGCGAVRAESVKATAPASKDSRGEDKNSVKKSDEIPGPVTGRSQPESTKVP
jgi:hypothetical protein